MAEAHTRHSWRVSLDWCRLPPLPASTSGEVHEENGKGGPLGCADPCAGCRLRARAAADPIAARCGLPSGGPKRGPLRSQGARPLCARPTDLGAVYAQRATWAQARQACEPRAACSQTEEVGAWAAPADPVWV